MDGKKVFLSTIIVAVLGLVGTIYTANKSDPIRVPQYEATLEAQKTRTAKAKEDALIDTPEPFPSLAKTSSPLPLTSVPSATNTSVLIDTPVPTNTSTSTPTIHPTAIPGDDWGKNCIDLTTWTPYLAGEDTPPTGYCAQLARWGITAQSGRLTFNTLESTSTAKEYGIITSLPGKANIKLIIGIEELENSEVWVGILDGDQPEKLSGFVFVIQPNRTMDFRSLSPSYGIVANTPFVGVTDTFPVEIILDAGDVSIFVDKANLVHDYPVSFSNRKLFIGYRSLPSTEVKVSVYDVEITEK